MSINFSEAMYIFQWIYLFIYLGIWENSVMFSRPLCTQEIYQGYWKYEKYKNKKMGEIFTEYWIYLEEMVVKLALLYSV